MTISFDFQFLLWTHKAIPTKDKTMPIPVSLTPILALQSGDMNMESPAVSSSSQQSDARTSADDFTFDKPLAQNGKEEGHGIHNRDGKT